MEDKKFDTLPEDEYFDLPIRNPKLSDKDQQNIVFQSKPQDLKHIIPLTTSPSFNLLSKSVNSTKAVYADKNPQKQREIKINHAFGYNSSNYFYPIHV